MKEIRAEELATKLNNGEKLNIIDVREDEEVAMGIIPGAKHIPLGELAERLDELEQDEHYYMVCRSGRRSMVACEILAEKDFEVTNMTGGMLDWQDDVEIRD
jgi:rhodanese-related sulfurtransferase